MFKNGERNNTKKIEFMKFNTLFLVFKKVITKKYITQGTEMNKNM